MTLYQGYAQQKGFDPVDIPDPSAKILAQGRDQMAAMEKVLAQNKAAAAQTVRDLERRAQIEYENSETNFNLKMGYRDIIAKSKWKNFEREIKNEEIRQKNRENSRQDLIALIKFVPTGLKAVKAMEEQRKKGVDQFARQIYDQYGIGAKKWNQIREIDRHTWNYSMHQEGFLAQMDLEGVPTDVLNRIRRSGGYASLRVAEMSALRLARRMEGVYAERANDQFEVAGQQLSINDAPSEHLQELFRLIEADEREKLGDAWPSSNVWYSSGAYDIAEQARASVRKKKVTNEQRIAESKQHDDELDIIKHQIGRNNGKGRWSGPIGIVSSTYCLAGGEDGPRESLVRARRRVVAATVQGLQTGEIQWEDVQGLENLAINVRGQKGKVKWGTHFAKEWRQIEEAGIKASQHETASALIGSKMRKAADESMLEELTQLSLSEESVSPSTWTQMIGIAQKKGFTKAEQYATKQLATGQNTDNDSIAEAILTARAARNEIITDTEIDALQMSDNARLIAKTEARKHNKFLPQTGEGGTAERLKSIIKAELEDIIPRNNAWDKNASHDDAAKGAFEIASGHYRTGIEKENMSHEAAYEYARDMITKVIRDPEGDFAKGGPPGNRGHKGYIADPNRDMIRTDTDYLHSVLRLEPTRVSSEPLLAEADVRSKIARLSKGLRTNVMPRAELIRSVTGIKHIDLLLGQREYYANKEIAETGATTIPEIPEWYIKEARRVEDFVGPNAQRLLDTYLPSKVNQAFMDSGNSVPYIEPIVSKVKPIAQKLSGGDYNSLGGESSNDLVGFDLTGATIRHVLLIAEEHPVVGAYQLSGEEIEMAADEAGIAFDTPFNSETQDKLFQTLLKSGGWEPPIIEDEEEALLVSSARNVLTNPNRSELGYHEIALLNPKARSYLYNIQERYATT